MIRFIKSITIPSQEWDLGTGYQSWGHGPLELGLVHSRRSTLTLTSHQFRMHDSTTTTTLLSTPSHPIIEHSTEISFGPHPHPDPHPHPQSDPDGMSSLLVSSNLLLDSHLRQLNLTEEPRRRCRVLGLRAHSRYMISVGSKKVLRPIGEPYHRSIKSACSNHSTRSRCSLGEVQTPGRSST